MAAVIITPFYLLLIPEFGYVGAALGLLITAIIHFYITLRASRRFYDMGLKMAPVLIKIALAVIAYTISEFVLVSSNFWYDIAQRTAVAMIAIAAMIGLLWRDPDRQQELRPLLVNTLKKLNLT